MKFNKFVENILAESNKDLYTESMKVEINTELLKKYIEINCYKHLGELTNFEKLTEKEITSLLEYFFDIEMSDKSK